MAVDFIDNDFTVGLLLMALDDRERHSAIKNWKISVT